MNDPVVENPKEAIKATQDLKRAPNVPRGQTSLLDLTSPQLNIKSPNRLSPEVGWFCPGLAYCMMGMDKDLFELYAWAIDKSVRVDTIITPNPVIEIEMLDTSKQRWFHILQALEQPLDKQFSDYISTYKFRNSEKNIVWSLRIVEREYVDPFSISFNKVKIRILLPFNETGNWSFQELPKTDIGAQRFFRLKIGRDE